MQIRPNRNGPSLRETFAALRHRDYRLWFGGQLISLIGTWMQSTAQGYFVFQLTKSQAYLGYVGFAAGLPTLALTLYGGVIADRMSRRRLLVCTQTAMMLAALLLGTLVFTGLVRPWHILALAFCLGVANAFDAPARQAFVVELVEREDLTNAIALNSTMFNTATVVGPAIGGIVYALLGPGWCFTVNGLSYLAVIAGLLLMRLGRERPVPRGGSIRAELREGLSYMAGDATARALVASVGVFNLIAIGAVTLMPAWAVSILHGGVTLNGLLLSARGVGALAGALLIAASARHAQRGRLLTVGSFLLPVSLLLFSRLRWEPAALAALVLMGWSFMVIANAANSMLQTRIPDALRGRVMGIYMMVFFGSMPLGALTAGAAAHRFGAPATIAVGAGLLASYAVFAWLRWPELRRLT